MPADAPRSRTAPLIAVLTVVFVAAMAFAVPPAPITPGGAGIYLAGAGRLSAPLAEQLARVGYAGIAIDFTDADLGEGALWRAPFERVDRRGFPIWGWVDIRGGTAHAEELARGEKLAGLFVYGPDAVAVAASLRRPSLEVVPVIREQDDAPPAGVRYGVAVSPARFPAAARGAISVLIADQLPLGDVEALRAGAGDREYVVARVAVLDFE